MKHAAKTALLVLALMGAGVHATVQAATDKKPTAASKGKAVEQAKSSKAGNKLVKADKADKGGKAQKTAAKDTGKLSASSGKSRKLAVAEPVARPVRKVSNILDDDPGRLALFSASALVIDQVSGHPLVEKQPHLVTPIASISKLMTAMVVLDAKQDLQEVIAIGDDDVDSLKGTRSRLPVGTTMTRETAMLLALMSSENRAAHALGRHYPGGLAAFVHAMNRKAQALGMTRSHFEEPTGLSSNNVSTAQDLARMVSAAARYPEIRNFSTTAEAKVDLNGKIRDFHNTNALVRSENWEIGVSKTGYISEAGRCLVMQARVADKPVVIVLLDSNGKMTRVGDAMRIKRWMESAHLAQDRRRV